MDAAVASIEKKIDNLQISDVFPVKSEATGKPDEPQKATSDKATDKNLSKPESKAIDKTISPVDKPAVEHGRPVEKPAEKPVDVRRDDGKTSQPARPAAGAEPPKQLPAQATPAVQAPVQPPTVTAGAVRSSSTSNEAKRSSLDGAQSKSANEKISYEIDFLKNLQFIGSSNQRPNFNIKQQVEILLPEPRTKNDPGPYNDMFDPGFGPMGRPGPVSITATFLVYSASP